MGSWVVDVSSEPGILVLRVLGALSNEEMESFVHAHNAAVDSFGTSQYKVFCDLREMSPLSPEAALQFENAKQHSSGRPNFQGSAVLVSSQLIAMQHRRTSITGGVMDSELISSDEAACREHLRRVRRGKRLK